MQKLYALLFVLICALGHSQNLLYHENFDPPSYRDSTFNLTVNGIRAFDTTSQIAASQPLSYHTKGYSTSGLSGTPYFRTTSFSTVGQQFVVLTFKHIAKTHFMNRCYISFSTDNGNTWRGYGSSSYFGGSNYGGNFSSGSYPEWQSNNDTAKPQPSWWKEETIVLNGIVNDTTGSTITGYPNVIVRFRAIFNVMPPTGFAAGWFIDDIKVTNYSCENIPPSFITNYNPLPCYRPYINGFTIAQSSGLYPIGVKVSDNGPFGSGVDSVTAFYQVKNGGPYGAMQSLPLPRKNPYSDEYIGYINNISAGDTVRYYITAVDNACPNTAHLPSQSNGPAFNTFFVSDTLPAKCGTAICGVNVIDSFPWTEDFDSGGWHQGSGNGNSGNSHRGNMPLAETQGWQVYPPLSDVYGWSVGRQKTGTTLTGPLTDASGNIYHRYLYTEFSQGPASKNTKLITPCIDLTDSVPRLFTFDYHMYGADIENLRVDIDSGLDSIVWVNGVALLTGQQHSSSIVPWKKYVVDLSPYAGRIIKIRFNSPANLPGDKKDVAIDNLEIRDLYPRDAALVHDVGDLNKPCGGAAGTPVNITLFNGGYGTLTEVPVAYQFDNNVVIRDTIRNINLNLLDTAYFTFSQLLSFNGNVNHQLKIWIELPLDGFKGNDTLNIQVPIKTTGVINTFPHILDFESASMDTTTNTLNLGTTQWFVEHQQLNMWVVENYSSNDYKYGPTTSFMHEGKFLKVDKQVIWQDSVVLRSGCIDLSSLSNPTLSFEHFNDGSYSFQLYIRPEDGVWEPLTAPLYSAMPIDVFQSDLGVYAGKVVEIAFLQNYYGSENMTLAIDNIIIGEEGTTDLAVIDVDTNILEITAGDTALENINITYGKTLQRGNTTDSTTLKVELKDICNPARPNITGQSSFGIFSSNWAWDRQLLSSITFSAPIPAGEYKLKLWLATVGDAIPQNDTLIVRVTVPARLPVPYFNDFEGCEVFFSEKGRNRQWEILTPPGGAYSGQKSVVTNEMKSLPGIHKLLAPTFYGLDTVLGAELHFWHRHNFQDPNEYGRVEYYRPTQGWLPVYAPGGANAPNKFTDSAGWAFSSYPLDHTTRANGELSMRFLSKITTPAKSGWAIDDFEIYVPTQLSAAPAQLLFVSGPPKDGSNDIAIKFYNSGRRSLDTVTLTVLDHTGKQLISEQLSFSPPLLWKQTRQITLLSKLPLDTSTRELTVITSRPNNLADALPADDTLRYQLMLLKEVDSLPYCSDFEADQELLSFNIQNGSLDTIWQHAFPQKLVINGTHSGLKAWVTGNSGSYPPMMNRYLYTPHLKVKGQKCYKFSFWHIYDTERNFDGGYVEYSLDSGYTWALLGKYNDSAWYNTRYIQSLDGVKPGFSGRSNGWIPASREFRVFWDGQIQFRFRFASNAAIGGDGWAIDDLCLEEISGSCVQVGLDNINVNKSGLDLFPNPASQSIGFVLNRGEGITRQGEILIFNVRGQLVKRQVLPITIGNRETLDISSLPNGVYSISLQFNDEIFLRSFVKM